MVEYNMESIAKVTSLSLSEMVLSDFVWGENWMMIYHLAHYVPGEANSFQFIIIAILRTILWEEGKILKLFKVKQKDRKDNLSVRRTGSSGRLVFWTQLS